MEDNNSYNNAKWYYYNVLKCIKEEKYNTIEELSNEANILIEKIKEINPPKSFYNDFSNVSKFINRVANKHYKSIKNLFIQSRSVFNQDFKNCTL
jgi:hypothetical protein